MRCTLALERRAWPACTAAIRRLQLDRAETSAGMTYPEWRPEDHDDYDEILVAGCAAELATIRTGGPEAAAAFLRDTREVHGRLYAPLAPAAFPEYAGHYRGTPGGSLQERRAAAHLVSRTGTRPFMEPGKVRSALDRLLMPHVDSLISTAPSDGADQAFFNATKVFYVFGLIHPYLDGNGHIQRLLFSAAMALRDDIELQDAWTIHPRPYDVDMAVAFEQPNAMQAVATLLSTYRRR